MTTPADTTYFSHVRREIEPLLPAKPGRVLEIGCGAGATLAWLKQRWPEAETVGVDGHAPVEPELARHVDRAVIHDLNRPLPDLGPFDLILALDVLEHLVEPAAVLANLVERLAPQGDLIVSVPNVANYRVLGPLLFKRRFRYEDAGLLDRTHLRFFTEESSLELMHSAGLQTIDGVMTGMAPGRARLANVLSFGAARHYLAMQYVMRGRVGGHPQRFRWRHA